MLGVGQWKGIDKVGTEVPKKRSALKYPGLKIREAQ